MIVVIAKLSLKHVRAGLSSKNFVKDRSDYVEDKEKLEELRLMLDYIVEE